MLFVCNSYLLMYIGIYVTSISFEFHSYVIRMSLACTRILSARIRMSFACHSYVLVCHPYVTLMYSYVTRKSLVCGFIMSHFNRLCLNATSIPTGYALLFLLK